MNQLYLTVPAVNRFHLKVLRDRRNAHLLSLIVTALSVIGDQ